MTKAPSTLPNSVFKRERRFIDSLRQTNSTIITPQGVALKLAYEIHDQLEESVLALMAGGLPRSHIEVIFEQPIIAENQVTGNAYIQVTELKDRAPENDQPPRPYYRGFLEPK